MEQQKIAEIHVVVAPTVGDLAKECQYFLQRGWELSGDIQLACDASGHIVNIAQRIILCE